MLSVRDLSNGQLLGIVRTWPEANALGDNIVVEDADETLELIDDTSHDPCNRGCVYPIG
jgi:hypothetical protein